ncbi:MAG: hypothetical protein QM528_08830 [Phycisphaerales bacterium]|nr:hypothetical protein [Phycisphaerales bacterium]
MKKKSLDLGSTLSRNEIKIVKGSAGSNFVKVTKDNLVQVNGVGADYTCCSYYVPDYHRVICLLIGGQSTCAAPCSGC